MSFSINFYQNSSESNRVDKSNYLSLVTTLTGTLREQCSLVTPSITIETTSLPTFNYVQIPTFNRYYFVRNITSLNNNLWRIDLDCDVLMSYAVNIYSQSALIERCESSLKYDMNLVDPYVMFESYDDYQVIEYTNNLFVTEQDEEDELYIFTTGVGWSR